ncbi:MAG: GNAT family N-acetyltransferase [Thermoplasmatales archaeon]|jgi:ribosomal protein S18 acetylase RimI-like enzyme|nr:GNAT family N-acetyltransferase [Candidatus Thermoplasmatota archaeon]MDA8055835.1 GNAT family N-acetyltransferase [Thermoplasmatales archaeon]
MAVEVKKLEGWFEKQKLMKILKNDYDNFYMLFDLDNFNFLLGNSSFLYAKSNNDITGILLNYYHSTGVKDIWLHGDNESEESLMTYVDKGNSVIHVRYNDNLAMFSDAPNVYREYCMVNEKPGGRSDENVKMLTQDKYTQYARLISQWENTRFKTMELDEFRNLLNYSTIFGYFVDDNLVSAATLGAIWKDWFVVSSVFTDPAHRNKGYVQKLISSMLDHYSNLDKAILFVNKDNAAAIKAYSNLGFRIYSEDLWVDYGTGLVP